jgi:hypothetical protein
VKDPGYFRQKAREAVAFALACDDASAKLAWLTLAERYRLLADSDDRRTDPLKLRSNA